MNEAYPVILFYKYVAIGNPEVFAAEQRALCSSLELKGRILIASEGINGTLAGPAEATSRSRSARGTPGRFQNWL